MISFSDILGYWISTLRGAGLPEHIQWRFRQELTIRPRPRKKNGSFTLSYVDFEPSSDENVAKSVYEDLRTEGHTIAVQRLFSTPDFSYSTISFDPWESDDEDYSNDYDAFFTVSDPYLHLIPVTESWAWRRHRLYQYRGLSGLDFVASKPRKKG